jgi:hypothetical protein
MPKLAPGIGVNLRSYRLRSHAYGVILSGGGIAAEVEGPLFLHNPPFEIVIPTDERRTLNPSSS